MENTPKLQWSKFSPDRSEQYVIRLDSWEEFVILKDKIMGEVPKTEAFPDDVGSPTATPQEKVQEQAKMCVLHNKEMKARRGKNGEVFYSHARPNGDTWEYCNGRIGFPSENQKE